VSLVAEAASQYFILRDLDNRLAIANQTVTVRQERLRIISERFNKGYVSELDKLMSIQQLTNATVQVPVLKRQIIQTENALRLLMAQGPGPVNRGATNFDQSLTPDIPVGLPSQLLERRPDIRAAESSLQSQFELIGMAQANRFPSISLTGLLGLASPELSTFISGSSLIGGGFGTLFGPIFHFGQNKRLVEVQKAKTQEVFYHYEQTVLSAFGDVDNALAQYKALVEEYAQLQIQVEAATKALTLSTARYDAGYTSYLEVSILENNLLNSQLQLSITLQEKLNAIVGLYKALGGGWDVPPPQ
jgi:multidrug efflux system outer membrane protein